ncbi:MAG: hypothetical protein AB8H03_26985 [Saprospiraceae bacterium]
MAMNNWGGITEHMTKKSRNFFGRKRKLSTDLDKNKLSDSKLIQANKKKKNKVIKEIMILVFVLFAFLIGIFLFLN